MFVALTSGEQKPGIKCSVLLLVVQILYHRKGCPGALFLKINTILSAFTVLKQRDPVKSSLAEQSVSLVYIYASLHGNKF